MAPTYIVKEPVDGLSLAVDCFHKWQHFLETHCDTLATPVIPAGYSRCAGTEQINGHGCQLPFHSRQKQSTYVSVLQSRSGQ